VSGCQKTQTKDPHYTKDIEAIYYCAPLEEKINILSHAIGFILNIVVTVFLITLQICMEALYIL
jgi:predicted membrane channel-forming protein YqfA (hemolysin III family)